MYTQFKVRFHLGQGENYMKWQVKNTIDNSVMYIDPASFSITLTGCRLMNRKSTAQKIHDGANKTVCAWIECGSVEIDARNLKKADLIYPIKYNPREAPHWQDSMGQDIDGGWIPKIQTMGRELFVI